MKTYIHIHTYILTHIHTHIYIHEHTHAYIYTPAYIHICKANYFSIHIMFCLVRSDKNKNLLSMNNNVTCET